MYTSFEKELGYKDVYLKPQKSVVSSRNECNTEVKLGNKVFKMPVYPANMTSIVNQETCEFLAKRGWFYTMHRFGINSVDFVRNMRELNYITSISTGMNLDSLIELNNIKISPDYITIDLANAWNNNTEELIKKIHDFHPDSFLIVGNVASADAVIDLCQWGAQAIKVGIAGGHACITKEKTGFYRPMVSTILDCAKESYVPIIADGGIETHGDIAKAIACGAHMIMAGMLFSGYDESARSIMEIDGKLYKEYFGNASELNKFYRRNIEGKELLIDYKGPMIRLLTELQEDLQSSISYAGGNDLSALNSGLLLEVK